ncbi:MAG: metal-dependent hydrolase [SAR324 cluster bacterium]|nr:metal-dependent hydrolase [SAR324 cluster bacterium]
MKNRFTISLFRIVAAAIFICFLGTAQAFELQWFGQAAFKLTTETGKVIMIDPFITKNPKTPKALKDLKKLGKVDLILITHGHFDHTADMVALSEMYDAQIGMNADMGSVVGSLGIVPSNKLIRWNKSGTVTPLGPDIKITMVHAEHSSTIAHKGSVFSGGEPVGYIIELENGKTIYHSGDTGIFSDMKLIGNYYKPDLALLCIGGHFTMDPVHAAYAARDLLEVPMVIPMHYGTFGLLKGTPEELIEALGEDDILTALNPIPKVLVMQPGDIKKF